MRIRSLLRGNISVPISDSIYKMLRRLSQNGSTLPAVTLISLLITFVSVWISPTLLPIERSNLFCSPPSGWFSSGWGSLLCGWACILFGAILSGRLNYTYALIRMRTTLPFFFLVVVFTFSPVLTTRLDSSAFVLLFFLSLLFILFSTYQQEYTQKQAFAIAFIVISLSFVVSGFILYLPLFIVVHSRMNSYRFKCLLASVVGCLTPLFLLFTYAFVFDVQLCVEAYLESFTTIDWIDFTRITPLLLTFVLFSVLTLALSIEGVLSQYSDKIQTRAYNSSLALFSLFSLIFVVFAYDRALTFLPVAGVCTALQLARYFTYARTQFSCYLFLLVLALFMSIYIWSLLPV